MVLIPNLTKWGHIHGPQSKNSNINKVTSQIQDKSIPPSKWWRLVKSVTKCIKKCKPLNPLNSNGKILTHPIDKGKSKSSKVYCSNFDTHENKTFKFFKNLFMNFRNVFSPY